MGCTSTIGISHGRVEVVTIVDFAIVVEIGTIVTIGSMMN